MGEIISGKDGAETIRACSIALLVFAVLCTAAAVLFGWPHSLANVKLIAGQGYGPFHLEATSLVDFHLDHLPPPNGWTFVQAELVDADGTRHGYFGQEFFEAQSLRRGGTLRTEGAASLLLEGPQSYWLRFRAEGATGGALSAGDRTTTAILGLRITRRLGFPWDLWIAAGVAVSFIVAGALWRRRVRFSQAEEGAAAEKRFPGKDPRPFLLGAVLTAVFVILVTDSMAEWATETNDWESVQGASSSHTVILPPSVRKGSLAGPVRLGALEGGK